MQCPNCDHEAPQAEFGDALRCPSCGAFYAKALAAKQRREAQQAEQTPVTAEPAEPTPPSVKKKSAGFKLAADHVEVATRGLNGAQPVVVVDVQMRFWSMVVFMVKWAIAAIPALLILLVLGTVAATLITGFFIGAGASSVNEVASVAPPSPAQAPSPPRPKSQELMKVRLVDKGFAVDKYDRGEITFSLEIANASSKDIRAFDGTLTFTDLLGNTILASKLAINDSLSRAVPMRWNGKIDYNQFIDKHERLRNEPLENVKVQFQLRSVLFEDGETRLF